MLMKKIFLLFLAFFSVLNLKAETFTSGSYIIDMGHIPQTYANGLQPYAAVYDLTVNHEVPVYWIIRKGKKTFETDFTYAGKDYKGSAFVIPAIYINDDVKNAIDEWRAKGVIIDGPTGDFDADAYNYITGFPNAILDEDNAKLTQGLFYDHVDIPSDFYTVGTPAEITACSDVYALPHADPQEWSQEDKDTYLSYITNAKGFLWQGCHSVGAVESPTYLDMHILTTNGQIAWKKDKDYAFENENSGKNFEHELSAGDNPIMQIASGVSDSSTAAQTDGSQKIYIPRPDSAWRSTTTVAVWDPANINLGLNGGNPNKAALIAFGRTYGKAENGILLQQASHTAITGTEAQNVSSGRFYANLLLQAVIERRPEVVITAPNEMYYPNHYLVEANVAGGASPYLYKWTSSCGGSFDDDTSRTPNYYPDNNDTNNCILRVKVWDSCVRRNFATKIINVHGYYPPIGYYNVTHKDQTFPSGEDSTDISHPDNALFTQITGQLFDVTLLSLAEDKQTLNPISGNFIVDIVDASGILIDDPKSCKEAPLLADVTDTVEISNSGLHFNNNSLAKATGIQYGKAHENVTFRVQFYDFHDSGDRIHGIPTKYDIAGGSLKIADEFPLSYAECTNADTWDCYRSIALKYGKNSCARDNFSVRSSGYNISLSSAPFIGGVPYALDANATDINNSVDTGYNQTIDGTSDRYISRQLVPPSGCTTLDTNESLLSANLKFVSGSNTTPYTYTYNNIGDIAIKIHDSTWSHVDQLKSHGGTIYNDCIAGSANNTPDATGKIGCNIESNASYTYLPDSFQNKLSVRNFNNGSSTYVASVENNISYMHADVNLSVQAVIRGGAVATNYTAGCFANDINYTLALVQDQNLSWGTAKARIKYAVNGSLYTSLVDISIPATATFNTTEASFLYGVSNQDIKFNFDRDISIPDDPFRIHNLDFNITSVTDGTTNGSDFNRTLDQNATFFYARAYPSQDFYPDITTSSVNTPVHIDIYCDPSVTTCETTWDINSTLAVTNDYTWWLALDHNASEGDGNITLLAGSPTGGSGSPSIAPTNVQVMSNGVENTIVVTANASSLPMTVPIEIVQRIDPTLPNYAASGSPYTNSWLIHNKDVARPSIPFYGVHFIGSSGWAGKGKTGHVVGGQVNSKKNRRLEW